MFFRFIMMVMLMAACFFAGRITAQEENFGEFIVEAVEQAEVGPQEILALARNEVFKTNYPELHNNLIVLLAVPQMQDELVNPYRSESPLYQKLVDLVNYVNAGLSNL